jgi:osmoprotectant transport system permease protein
MVKKNIWTIVLLGLLLLFTFIYDDYSGVPDNLMRESLIKLMIDHAKIVGVSSLIAIFLGIALGTFVYIIDDKEMTKFILDLGRFGDTFPTVALLAILVPFLGFGSSPVIISLIVYGILPVLKSTVVGFEQVDKSVIESAIGMGFSRINLVFKILFPLSKLVILSGIRITIILGIAIATVGAAVGSGGLGVPIVDGIRLFNLQLVLRGAIPVSLLAFIVQSFINSFDNDLTT